MVRQYFIQYNNQRIYIVAWIAPENKKNVFICPPIIEMSLSGVRYFTSKLAQRLYDSGCNIVSFSYPYTGNSGYDIEKLTYGHMLAAAESAVEFVCEELSFNIDIIAGVAGGNYLISPLTKKYAIPETLFINPNDTAVKAMLEQLVINPESQSDNLLRGYLQAQYDNLVENGSDATFSIMNMEDPDTELLFWDTVSGPFFGGENLSIGLTLLNDLADLRFRDMVEGLSHTAAFFWGSSQKDKLKDLFSYSQYVGAVSNEGYWLESSLLYDKVIEQIRSYSKSILGGDARTVRTSYAYTRIEQYSTFIEGRTLTLSNGEAAGILHGPISESSHTMPLVVFEHGLGCDSVSEYGAWVRLSELLACKGVYCYRYDHIGSGINCGDFSQSSYDGYKNELIETIQLLRIDSRLERRPIVLISWSFGAYISLLTAKELGEDIVGSVFWSPALSDATATSKVRLFRGKDKKFRFPISPLWLDANYLKEEKKIYEQLPELYDQFEIPHLLIVGAKDNQNYNRMIMKGICSKDAANKAVTIDYTGHCFSRRNINYIIDITENWIAENLC